MKLAITGDTHVHSYTGRQVRTLPDGTNSRLRDTLDALTWVARDAREQGCAAVLHAGDLFHSRRTMPNEAWSRAGAALRTISENIDLHVLVGNHDMSASGDGTSTVAALDGIIQAVTFAARADVDGFPVGWIPYVEDPEEVRQHVARLREAGARIIVGHMGIGDPKLSRCVPTDYEVPGRINVSDLSPEDFDAVFLGHYHTPQDIAPNARYVGAPLHLTFGDAGSPRGYWIYDTDTREAEFVENTDSPRFVKATAEEVTSGKVKPRAEDFLWVTGASREEAEELASMGSVGGVAPRVDLAPVSSEVKVRIPDAAQGEDAILDAYVRGQDTTLDDLERTALVRLGRELVDKAGAHHG